MRITWHRIFGMALTQYLAGTGWKVDVEVDLSLKLQLLDLVVLRRLEGGPEPLWPDGFGVPADYNLLTFKALHDALDGWALHELAAHGVSYRKLMSPHPDRLLPESSFRWLAASMRFPRGLAKQIDLRPQGAGAYDVQLGTATIRILVLNEMPAAVQNLVWNLFSGDPQRIAGAFQLMQPERSTWSSLVNDLLAHYGLEGMAMPYTMEDYERDVTERVLQKLTPEELAARLTPEQRLAGLPPEQRLAGLPPEQRLAGLSAEEIESVLRKMKAEQDKAPPA